MPTPVSAARQCLAADSAAALDEAVSAARRRSHAQTTSLHVVFALLSSSTPPLLRDALSRSRSSSYSPRLQFKALDLCFSVALDRLPSSSSSSSSSSHHDAADHPPAVSNSLMAAIKRSQAHQRRNPDTFHLYHHHHQQQQQQQQSPSSSSSSSSSFSGVKVELQQLVLAILDDPVVNRVFGDAGFRSCDIKLAVLRPPPPLLRFPRAARCPPLFLCSFSATRDDFSPSAVASPRGFPFTFPGSQLCSDGGDEDCRRIGEVIARPAGRNPVLVGVGAAEAARNFARAVELQNWSVLPPEVHGLRLVSIEREVVELASDVGDRSSIGMRLEELSRKAEEPGVVVSIGDLTGLVEGGGDGGAASCLVSELTRLLELQGARMWVMGWLATYEAYMKLLSRYPLLDKDWDLQLLPITSLRPPAAAATGSITRPHSLMESFVPFGGFFPAAYELKSPLSKLNQSVVRCQHCNERYNQEVASLKECSTLVEDRHLENMPTWLRNGNLVSRNDGLDSKKAKDDKSVLSAKLIDLQKKWNDNCQRLHQGSKILGTDNNHGLSHIGSIPYVSDKERDTNQISNTADVAQSQSDGGNAFPAAVGLQKITRTSQSSSLPLVSEPKDSDLISKLQVRLSTSEPLQTNCFESHQDARSELAIPGDHASPSSVTSVTTDLVLGTHHEPPCQEEKPVSRMHMERLQGMSGCMPPKKVHEFCGSVPELSVHSYHYSAYPSSFMKDKYPAQGTLSGSKVTSCAASSYDQQCHSSYMCNKFDPSNYNAFSTSLIEKVGRQKEAVHAVSKAIERCRTGHESRCGASPKGHIWLSLLGSDKVGKRKTAVALAELIFGSRNNLICIDFGYQDGLEHPNTLYNQMELSEYDMKFRGKTIVDHVAEEIGKKPSSVVFLENINKADWSVQKSLSKAIRTGKFSDSRGREFSINNTIFLISEHTIQGKAPYAGSECINFSEERILGAQGWQMKILLESFPEAAVNAHNTNVSITSRQESKSRRLPSCSVFVSKRKLPSSNDHEQQHGRALKRSNTLLDLNLPVEEAMAGDADCSSSDDNALENSDSWLEEFLKLTDETITFKPYDFEHLADCILKEISKCFCNMIGCDWMLEIDVKVMEQILAATWLLDNKDQLNSWLENVLARSLIELRKRYNLSNRTIARLVPCEGAPMDRADGILLPSCIIVE